MANISNIFISKYFGLGNPQKNQIYVHYKCIIWFQMILTSSLYVNKKLIVKYHIHELY